MTADDIDRVARESFGIDQLKAAQRDAIDAAVRGRDVLGVLATGYGKSAMYQIAATLREGVTVVVSPLIALQEDQLVGIENVSERTRVDVERALLIHPEVRLRTI